MLVVHFNDSYYRLSNRREAKALKESSMVLRKNIRKQMELNDLSGRFLDLSAALESGLKWILLLMLLLAFLSARPSKVFQLLIQSLTLVLHFPILAVVLPGNVISQVELTLTVALFDVLEVFFDWGSIEQLQFAEVESD